MKTDPQSSSQSNLQSNPQSNTQSSIKIRPSYDNVGPLLSKGHTTNLSTYYSNDDNDDGDEREREGREEDDALSENDDASLFSLSPSHRSPLVSKIPLKKYKTPTKSTMSLEVRVKVRVRARVGFRVSNRVRVRVRAKVSNKSLRYLFKST
jgi:hypothetical protein